MTRAICQRVYRWACRIAPLGLAPIWRERMEEDFRARLADPVEHGPLGAVALTAGALLDLVSEASARTGRAGARRLRSRVPNGGGGWMMDSMWHDLRYAVRGLTRAPGFTIVVVVTLTLAIGANSTLFSVVDGVLLEPLPYDAPDELHQIEVHFEDGARDPYSSFADFVDVRAELSGVAGVAAYHQSAPTFTADGAEPLRLGGLVVSADFFRTIGLDASLGRGLTRADVLERNDDVAVLGYGLWQSAFGGDPDVLGRSIELNGRTRTVIGVGPAAFPSALPGIGRAQVYLPLSWEASDDIPGRASHNLLTMVRVAPEAPVDRVEAELDEIMARLREAYPDTNDGKSADLIALHDRVVGGVRGGLGLLLAGVALVLLIAVANVTSVLLGRAAEREREIGLRTALGASRGRIYAQLLTEGLVLAMLGGAAGVALAYFTTDRLVAWLGRSLPRTDGIAVDLGVLGASVAVTVGAGLFMGLAPAWSLGRSELTEAIRSGGTGRGMAGRSRQRLRGALVVAQVGLCLTLLMGSGLLIRTLGALHRVDVGVDTEVLSFGLHLPDARYPEWSDHDVFHTALEERLERIAGIEEVGSINGVPLSDTGICGTLYAEEDPDRFAGGDTCAQVRSASPDYFSIMGIELLQGRFFGEGDDPEADLIVINQATADLLWPGENPLGRRIMTGFRGSMFEVIGVVENVKQFELGEAPLYQTYLWERRWRNAARELVVDLSADPSSLTGQIREAVWELDPLLPLYSVRTIGELRDGRMAEDRLRAILLTAMSLLALLLAAVGIYGVISFSVSRRQREMAIRMSIGAKAGSVRRLVLVQALQLVVAGLLVGAVGGTAFGRALSSFLFEVQPNDPLTMVGVAGVLLAAAGAAAFIPARRATRVDPMLVLREE